MNITTSMPNAKPTIRDAKDFISGIHDDSASQKI
jgi:hypothetical protein